MYCEAGNPADLVCHEGTKARRKMLKHFKESKQLKIKDKLYFSGCQSYSKNNPLCPLCLCG
jgi:hypothetical protein